ncbi:serine/threonine protein kinase [Noviherbaspirillum cavernae]|uniref:non-specific serine/threonine protein kinase n=1 Tax=Noviherbaspirillum cavernae TaxID=2320862 RepID=A0A418X007_9BURK|nr:serine/threonine-protein kinase [Noviherbaspirillum cavernae]RJG05655.1 serine/threonine protein kinase [Noviherbaspirillum cavernae]
MTFEASPPLASVTPSVNRIGRFHITRELGRGSAGCVYFAHDPVVGRDIALKTFNPRLTPVEKNKYEQQFINEARAAGRLSHPHIVTIYDASSENGTTYIAMEYLQGRELNKMLDGGHRFTPHEVASIAWKVADALDHAHKNEVIHRDVKPANIFMVNDDHPKLVDFGIARSPNRVAARLVNDDQPYTLFRNNLLGTPNYMSPEQACGKPVDARTDIYSLGAVMYEMLVGRKPFATKDADLLLQQVAHKAPRAPREIDPQIPVILSQIVMKAMSKRPEKRYATAEQMALDIKRYLVRERRARRRMQLPLAGLDKNEEGSHPLERSRLFWLGCTAVALAVAIVAMRLL